MSLRACELEGGHEEAQNYSFSAGTLSPGGYQLRLRQIDLDGTESFSDELDVAPRLDGPYALSAYPNPLRAGTGATVDLTAREAQHVTVALYDVLGRRVAVLFDAEVAAGQTEALRLSAQGLASGVYVVRVIGERFMGTRRITVARERGGAHERRRR